LKDLSATISGLNELRPIKVRRKLQLSNFELLNELKKRL
jgi:hypothetical protein